MLLIEFFNLPKEVPVEEHIVKVKGGYELKSKHSNKNLGKYPTKAGAEKRERQVQYFKHQTDEDFAVSNMVTNEDDQWHSTDVADQWNDGTDQWHSGGGGGGAGGLQQQVEESAGWTVKRTKSWPDGTVTVVVASTNYQGEEITEVHSGKPMYVAKLLKDRYKISMPYISPYKRT